MFSCPYKLPPKHCQDAPRLTNGENTFLGKRRNMCNPRQVGLPNKAPFQKYPRFTLESHCVGCRFCDTTVGLMRIFTSSGW